MLDLNKKIIVGKSPPYFNGGDLVWGNYGNDPMSPPNKDKIPAMFFPAESLISKKSFNKWVKKNSGKLRKLNNRVNGEK